jgi:Zn-finger nucleic acid-binding protein
MNCEQCGAPIKVEDSKDFFHCDYCGSFQFSDPNKDGIALLDMLSLYGCPNCQRPLVTAIIKDVRIFSCPSCRGNLISQAKLLTIIKRAASPDMVGEVPSYPPDRSEIQRKLVCPGCQKTMEAYPYAGPGNIIIQGCSRCRLIWLDFGELFRIVRSYSQIYQTSPDELGAKKQGIKF